MTDTTLVPPTKPLGWGDVETLAAVLAGQVRSSGWMPDAIVAVARGGLVPAQLLAHRLGVREVTAVGARFADKARTLLRLYAAPTWPLGVPRRVLVVEDAVDTGRLLQASAARMPGEVQTAALIAVGAYRPDYLGAAVWSIPRMPWEMEGAGA